MLKGKAGLKGFILNLGAGGIHISKFFLRCPNWNLIGRGQLLYGFILAYVFSSPHLCSPAFHSNSHRA